MTNDTTVTIPCPDSVLKASSNEIEMCETATVVLDPPTCVPFTIFVEPNDGDAMLDGNVVRPVRPGSVTIVAEYKADDITCTKRTTVTIKGSDCSSCGSDGAALATAGTHAYDIKGRLVKTNLKDGDDEDVIADTLYEYDDNGAHMPNEAYRSGLDVNENGTLDVASSDRITESHSHFTYESDEIWQVSQSITYPTINDATPLTLSSQRRRLTGLGESLTTGIVTGYVESTDIHENVTITTTTLDTSNHKITQTTNHPDSTIDGLIETVDGMVTTQRSKTGITSYMTYDGLMRRKTASDPRTGFFMTYYNSTGQVDYVMDSAGKEIHYTYDSAGRVSVVINDDGKATRYDYNSRGQVIKTWGDAATPVEIHYDDYGQRDCMMTYREDLGWDATTWPGNGSGDETQWEYDEPTGLLLNKEYADASKTQYEYTPEGKLLRRFWARPFDNDDLVTEYDYHCHTGELTDIVYLDNNTPNVAFTYTRFGAIKTVEDGLGIRTFGYNTELQPTTEELDGLIDRTLSRSYETNTSSGAVGRSNGFDVMPNGGSPDYAVGYAYDSMGRLNKVTGPGLNAGGAVYSFLVDGSFPVSDMVGEIAFKDGTTNTIAKSTRTFEVNRDLIDHIENRWMASGGSGTLVSKYDYANDDLGRRINVVNTGTAFQSGGRNTVFGYDDRSQLTTSNRREGTTPGSGTEVQYQQYEFGYDSIGNRRGYWGDDHPEWVKEYVSNELNQYSENSTPEYFTHDLDGNLIEDGDYEYVWDAENRLIEVTPKNPSSSIGHNRKVHFEYDYMSRRIRKYTYAWTGSAWATTIAEETHFVYDGWNLVQELNGRSSNTLLRQYTWGLDLSGQSGNPSPAGIHGAGGIGGLLATYIPGVSSNRSYFYMYDANGNVGQMLTPSGVTAAKYEYYPFGGLLVASGAAAAENPFRFSTKYRDNEIGSYYYGYRYLRTKHGRWLNRDILGEPADSNLYRFVANSPASLTDSVGLEITVIENEGGYGTLTLSELLKKMREKGHPLGDTDPTRLFWDPILTAANCRTFDVPSCICSSKKLYFCNVTVTWKANHTITVRTMDITPNPDTGNPALSEKISKCIEKVLLDHEREHVNRWKRLDFDYNSYGIGAGCSEMAALEEASDMASKLGKAISDHLIKNAKRSQREWDKIDYPTLSGKVTNCFLNP